MSSEYLERLVVLAQELAQELIDTQDIVSKNAKIQNDNALVLNAALERIDRLEKGVYGSNPPAYKG